MKTLLFGVTATDPLTFITVNLSQSAVALLGALDSGAAGDNIIGAVSNSCDSYPASPCALSQVIGGRL